MGEQLMACSYTDTTHTQHVGCSDTDSKKETFGNAGGLLPAFVSVYFGATYFASLGTAYQRMHDGRMFSAPRET